MKVGIERLLQRFDRLDTELVENFEEFFQRHVDALHKAFGLPIFPGNREGALEVVDDAQQIAEQRLIEFAGYRVDQAGIPTFLYRLGPWDIEDRMEARDQESLLRTWTIRRSDRPAANENESAISLCPHAARQLKSVRPMSMVDQNGLTVTVTSEGNHQGEIVRFESLQHWLIPLEDKQEQVFKAEYRW